MLALVTKNFREQIRMTNKPAMAWQCSQFCRVANIWGQRVASILPPQPQSRQLGLERWRLLLNELMRKASHILEGVRVSTTTAKESCSHTGCVIHNGSCSSIHLVQDVTKTVLHPVPPLTGFSCQLQGQTEWTSGPLCSHSHQWEWSHCCMGWSPSQSWGRGINFAVVQTVSSPACWKLPLDLDWIKWRAKTHKMNVVTFHSIWKSVGTKIAITYISPTLLAFPAALNISDATGSICKPAEVSATYRFWNHRPSIQ